MALPVLKSVEEIANAVKAKQPFLIDDGISTINFGSVYFGRAEEPDQFRVFTDALKASSSVTSYTSLILHQQEQVQLLADALRTNRSIRSLDFSTKLGPGCNSVPILEALSSSNIEDLNLAMNIAPAQQPPFMQALADLVRSSNTLRTLSLSRDRIGDEGARVLSEAIKSSNSLRSINLEDNEITDVGVGYICGALRYHPSVTSLNLNSNKIRIDGARSLADLLMHTTALRTLDVGCTNGLVDGNYLGDEGCRILGDALKRNSTLTHLSLRRNDITISGFTELIVALKNNIGLSVLDVSKNAIGCRDPQQWKYIEESLSYNSALYSLHLGDNYLNTDEMNLLTRVRNKQFGAGPNMVLQNDMDRIIGEINGTIRVEQKTMDQILDEMYPKKY